MESLARIPTVTRTLDLAELHRRDLKQLVTLLALLRTRSVTEAARQLGVAQPTVSKSLERLRRDFNDALLIRDGNRMRLTPKGEEILPRLSQALCVLGDAISAPSHFDPARASRRVSIGTNDYLQGLLTPSLLRELRRQAPGVSLHFKPVGMWRLEHLLNEGLVDMVIGADAGVVSHRSQPLFSEELVCIAASTSRLPQLDVQTFCEQPQLDVSPAGIGLIPGMLDRAVAGTGLRRRTVATISTFLAVPKVLEGTDLVSVVPLRVAETFHPSMVRQVAISFDLPRYDVALWWHNNTHADPLSVWLRNLIAATARNVAR